MSKRVALGLFSGGLDSILACRVVADQGVRVIALKFVTPFFDHELLDSREAYARAMLEKYSVAFSARALKIAERAMRVLDKGFTQDACQQMARIL